MHEFTDEAQFQQVVEPNDVLIKLLAQELGLPKRSYINARVGIARRLPVVIPE